MSVRVRHHQSPRQQAEAVANAARVRVAGRHTPASLANAGARSGRVGCSDVVWSASYVRAGEEFCIAMAKQARRSVRSARSDLAGFFSCSP